MDLDKRKYVWKIRYSVLKDGKVKYRALIYECLSPATAEDIKITVKVERLLPHGSAINDVYLMKAVLY
jgi:hypothetical protein